MDRHIANTQMIRQVSFVDEDEVGYSGLLVVFLPRITSSVFRYVLVHECWVCVCMTRTDMMEWSPVLLHNVL